MFVLDASVALTWCFQRDARKDAVAVLDLLVAEPACVPALWRLEVANGLAVAERRGAVPRELADALSAELAELPLIFDDVAPALALDVLRSLARSHRLTVYDAAYLELATRRNLPLATLDGSLAGAAKEVGVPLLLD